MTAQRDASPTPAQLAQQLAPAPAVAARGLPLLWALGALAFLIAALLLALTIGPFPIGAWAIVRGALSHLPVVGIHSPLTPLQSAIVWQVRAPRVVLGALVGAMLAVAGSAYQGTFRNPLADPYLLGVSEGAGAGATVVIAFVPHASGTELLPAAAFAGALIAVLCAYALGNSVAREGGTGA
ncbi:MAG: iron chelate uptake ABC transporter family permease subunit, partial [Solirubrobacteraceae bacterium]